MVIGATISATSEYGGKAKRAHRPGYTGDRTPTPPGGLNDVLAKRSDIVHCWGDVGGGCCHRGGSPGRVFYPLSIDLKRCPNPNDIGEGALRYDCSRAFAPRGGGDWRPFAPRAASGHIFNRLIRRGSASSTSYSNSPGPRRISPRPGTRPAEAVTRPPIVSTSSASASEAKSNPTAAETSSSASAGLDDEGAVS